MYIVTVIRDEGLRRYGYSDKETAIRRAYEFAEGSFGISRYAVGVCERRKRVERKEGQAVTSSWGKAYAQVSSLIAL